jgi:hypothetical protein
MHPLLAMPRNKVGGEVEEIELEPDTEGGDLTTAAEGLLTAIQSGSADEVAEAFKSMMEICNGTNQE